MHGRLICQQRNLTVGHSGSPVATKLPTHQVCLSSIQTRSDSSSQRRARIARPTVDIPLTCRARSADLRVGRRNRTLSKHLVVAAEGALRNAAIF